MPPTSASNTAAAAATAAAFRRTNFPTPIGRRVAPRPHRPAVEVTAQVVGELLGRGIPPLRLLAHRHQHDRVQVAGQGPPEPGGRGPPGRGDLLGDRPEAGAGTGDGAARSRSDPTGAVVSSDDAGAAAAARARPTPGDDRRAGPLGRLLADGLEDLRDGPRPEPIRPAARQELVEHHAQRHRRRWRS